MVKKQKPYPHNDLTDCLEEILRAEKKYAVHRNIEDFPELRGELENSKLLIDPRLPVDLIYANKVMEETESEDKKEYWHYTLILVNSTKEISDKLINRLHFYQFYLTRIGSIQPSRLSIVVAIPHIFNVARKKKKDFEYYGFGLWKVDTDGKKKTEIVAAKNLRDRISSAFSTVVRESKAKVTKKKKWLPITKIAKGISIDPEVLKNAIIKEAQDFVLFFEEYIDEAVEGIAGMSPEQFGKRYIDREILHSALKLENISYRDVLSRLVSKHLTEKESDYDFTKNCFKTLWKNNFNEDYPLTLGNFEALLQQFFPTYREHFIHQFQVFLLGTIIINHLLKDPSNLSVEGGIDIQKDNLIKGWTLTSTIHDFTYPLQQYDVWSSDFVREQLSISEQLSFLELKNIYVEEDFSTCTEYLLSQLKNNFIDADSWQRNKFHNAIRRFCYYEKTEKKNHGLMCSFYLQKKFRNENKFDREFQEKILQPTAVAIAMHDNEIWQVISGQVNGNIEQRWKYIAEVLGLKELVEHFKITRILKNDAENDEEKNKQIAKFLRDEKKNWIGDIYNDISYIIETKPIRNLDFKGQPLAFLLILLDNLQDYGRPCENDEYKQGMEEADIRLKEISYDQNSKTVTIQLFFSQQTEKSMRFIIEKIAILRKIEEFLRSPDIKFIIEYWDREKEKKYQHRFTIN